MHSGHFVLVAYDQSDDHAVAAHIGLAHAWEISRDLRLVELAEPPRVCAFINTGYTRLNLIDVPLRTVARLQYVDSVVEMVGIRPDRLLIGLRQSDPGSEVE